LNSSATDEGPADLPLPDPPLFNSTTTTMFKRNVTVTNSHQMSGKDVKKLVKQVALIFPSLSEKEVKQIIPNKTEVLVTKLSNRCFAYSVAGNPVFFEHEDVIYPSVYTLWAYPDMLPTLYTHSEVSPKIVGGADLMLPGVIVPEAGLGDFQVRDHSAISIPENPFPFAVGYIETDSESIKENGLKGRGIKVRCLKTFVKPSPLVLSILVTATH
jgi:translation initiation factor 2D